MSRFQRYRKWRGGYWYHDVCFGWTKISLSMYMRSVDRAKFMKSYHEDLYEDWS